MDVVLAMGSHATSHLHRIWRVRNNIWLNHKKILYGIDQGSCAYPILWALLDQLILTAPEEKFNCMRLVAIYGVEEHIQPGDSFVDDTTCGATGDDIPAELVSSEVQELLEREEELIEHI
jgi:hypothetical protein